MEWHTPDLAMSSHNIFNGNPWKEGDELGGDKWTFEVTSKQVHGNEIIVVIYDGLYLLESGAWRANTSSNTPPFWRIIELTLG